MKKSKFLKKSLAMLLALMLVVAMIPLSAAAVSLPALDYLIVEGTKVEVENGTLNATYPEDATSVRVSTVLDSNVKLYAL